MSATPRAIDLAIAAATAADLKVGRDIVALDVSEHMVLTDVFVIITANNERQVKSVVDAVEEALAAHGAKSLRREGLGEARWVLVDFGDVVVHVQLPEERVYYDIERLWKDCPRVALPASVGEQTAGQSAAAESGS